MKQRGFDRFIGLGFLAIGGFIAIESLKAYRLVGEGWNGRIGGIMAMILFLMVQGFEMWPIIMARGDGKFLGLLAARARGKEQRVDLPDPEEYRDASKWACGAYLVDFCMGMIVWPFPWSLITVGGLTSEDVLANRGNLIMLIGCVFGLQFCVSQYLKRGGKLPGDFRKQGGQAHA